MTVYLLTYLLTYLLMIKHNVTICVALDELLRLTAVAGGMRSTERHSSFRIFVLFSSISRVLYTRYAAASFFWCCRRSTVSMTSQLNQVDAASFARRDADVNKAVGNPSAPDQLPTSSLSAMPPPQADWSCFETVFATGLWNRRSSGLAEPYVRRGANYYWRL